MSKNYTSRQQQAEQPCSDITPLEIFPLTPRTRRKKLLSKEQREDRKEHCKTGSSVHGVTKGEVSLDYLEVKRDVLKQKQQLLNQSLVTNVTLTGSRGVLNGTNTKNVEVKSKNKSPPSEQSDNRWSPTKKSIHRKDPKHEQKKRSKENRTTVPNKNSFRDESHTKKSAKHFNTTLETSDDSVVEIHDSQKFAKFSSSLNHLDKTKDDNERKISKRSHHISFDLGRGKIGDVSRHEAVRHKEADTTNNEYLHRSYGSPRSNKSKKQRKKDSPKQRKDKNKLYDGRHERRLSDSRYLDKNDFTYDDIHSKHQRRTSKNSSELQKRHVQTWIYDLLCCHNYYSIGLYLLILALIIGILFVAFKIYVLFMLPKDGDSHSRKDINHRHWDNPNSITSLIPDYDNVIQMHGFHPDYSLLKNLSNIEQTAAKNKKPTPAYFLRNPMSDFLKGPHTESPNFVKNSVVPSVKSIPIAWDNRTFETVHRDIIARPSDVISKIANPTKKQTTVTTASTTTPTTTKPTKTTVTTTSTSTTTTPTTTSTRTTTSTTQQPPTASTTTVSGLNNISGKRFASIITSTPRKQWLWDGSRWTWGEAQGSRQTGIMDETMGIRNNFGYNSIGVTQPPYTIGYSIAGQRTTNGYQKWWRKYHSLYFQYPPAYHVHTTASPKFITTPSWTRQYRDHHQTETSPSSEANEYHRYYSPDMNDDSNIPHKISSFQPSTGAISNDDVTAMYNYRETLESNIQNYIDQIKEKEKAVNERTNENETGAESGKVTSEKSKASLESINDIRSHSKHSNQKHQKKRKNRKTKKRRKKEKKKLTHPPTIRSTTTTTTTTITTTTATTTTTIPTTISTFTTTTTPLTTKPATTNPTTKRIMTTTRTTPTTTTKETTRRMKPTDRVVTSLGMSNRHHHRSHQHFHHTTTAGSSDMDGSDSEHFVRWKHQHHRTNENDEDDDDDEEEEDDDNNVKYNRIPTQKETKQHHVSYLQHIRELRKQKKQTYLDKIKNLRKHSGVETQRKSKKDHRLRMLESIRRRVQAMKQRQRKNKSKEKDDEDFLEKVGRKYSQTRSIENTCSTIKQFHPGTVARIKTGPEYRHQKIVYIIRACRKTLVDDDLHLKCKDIEYKIDGGQLKIKKSNGVQQPRRYTILACHEDSDEDKDADEGDGSSDSDLDVNENRNGPHITIPTSSDQQIDIMQRDAKDNPVSPVSSTTLNPAISSEIPFTTSSVVSSGGPYIYNTATGEHQPVPLSVEANDELHSIAQNRLDIANQPSKEGEQYLEDPNPASINAGKMGDAEVDVREGDKIITTPTFSPFPHTASLSAIEFLSHSSMKASEQHPEDVEANLPSYVTAKEGAHLITLPGTRVDTQNEEKSDDPHNSASWMVGQKEEVTKTPVVDETQDDSEYQTYGVNEDSKLDGIGKESENMHITGDEQMHLDDPYGTKTRPFKEPRRTYVSDESRATSSNKGPVVDYRESETTAEKDGDSRKVDTRDDVDVDTTTTSYKENNSDRSDDQPAVTPVESLHEQHHDSQDLMHEQRVRGYSDSREQPINSDANVEQYGTSDGFKGGYGTHNPYSSRDREQRQFSWRRERREKYMNESHEPILSNEREKENRYVRTNIDWNHSYGDRHRQSENERDDEKEYGRYKWIKKEGEDIMNDDIKNRYNGRPLDENDKLGSNRDEKISYSHQEDKLLKTDEEVGKVHSHKRRDKNVVHKHHEFDQVVDENQGEEGHNDIEIGSIPGNNNKDRDRYEAEQNQHEHFHDDERQQERYDGEGKQEEKTKRERGNEQNREPVGDQDMRIEVEEREENHIRYHHTTESRTKKKIPDVEHLPSSNRALKSKGHHHTTPLRRHKIIPTTAKPSVTHGHTTRRDKPTSPHPRHTTNHNTHTQVNHRQKSHKPTKKQQPSATRRHTTHKNTNHRTTNFQAHTKKIPSKHVHTTTTWRTHKPTKNPQMDAILKSLKQIVQSNTKRSVVPKPTKTPTVNINKLPVPTPYILPLHDTSKLKILCFGDSLTAGYHHHGKAFAPYCQPMQSMLTERTHLPVRADVKGIVGEMTHKQMTQRLPLVLGNATFQYDWIVILGGTNDILHVKNFADDEEFLNQLENVWQPRITKDIEKLHSISYRYGAHTVLLTVPENAIEQWPEYKPLMKMRNKINNALKRFAYLSNGQTVLCDVATKVPRHSLGPAQEAIMWDDHLHMTPTGYGKMARVVSDCLEPYLPHRK